MVEAEGVEPDISVENTQLTDSVNNRIDTVETIPNDPEIEESTTLIASVISADSRPLSSVARRPTQYVGRVLVVTVPLRRGNYGIPKS